MIQIRYIVNDVDKAVEFYTSNLDFRLEQQFGPAVAILERDGVKLVVTGPNASASLPLPDGSKPSPGGWNRFIIYVDDIESVVSKLKQNGVQFKNEIIEGRGGKQVLCLDPSETIVEIFETNQNVSHL